MRDMFRGYYPPTPEEFAQMWSECFFVVDTNVLLNLYRYSPEISKTLLNVLESLQDRIWLPHNFAEEYHKQYMAFTVVPPEYDRCKQILSELTKNLTEPFNQLKSRTNTKTDILLKQFNKTVKQLEKKLDDEKKKHQTYLDTENISTKIAQLFENKVGKPYDEDRLEDIYRNGKKRYEKKIPPGFGDAKKDEPECYGDLVSWFQIMDQAKESKKPVIFITQDSKKDDWFWRQEGKTIGPLPKLVQELYAFAGVGLHIYTIDKFLEYAKEFINASVNQNVIDEVREFREEEEKQSDYLTSKLLTSQLGHDIALAKYKHNLDQIDYMKMLLANPSLNLNQQFNNITKDISSALSTYSINPDMYLKLAMSITPQLEALKFLATAGQVNLTDMANTLNKSQYFPKLTETTDSANIEKISDSDDDDDDYGLIASLIPSQPTP